MILESKRPHLESLLEENVALAEFSTLGVGGPARYLCRAQAATTMADALEWARVRQLPVFLMGGGSNVLIADRGFDGLVIKVEVGRVDIEPAGDLVVVTAGAGIDWDRLVALSVENGWQGLECLSGIPGLVGATPIQNVGAYGQEVSETIISVDALDLRSGSEVSFKRDECGFGYRTSRFKTSDKDRFAITRVKYALRSDGPPAIRYPELQEELEDATTPSLSQVRNAVINLRRRKAMVLDPTDPDSRSAGSFFLNPVVSAAELDAIRERADSLGVRSGPMPAFPLSGGTKVSAAWLIENSGFDRGFALQNAGISRKHALAIVNRGNATATQILSLARTIISRVRDRFGVTLEPEPVFVGFDEDELEFLRLSTSRR